MNSTKKMILATGMLFQLSASLYADNWSDAVSAFGGVDAVYNNRGSLSWAAAQKIAKQLGTAEAMSIGLYESNGNPAVVANKFPGAQPANVVVAQLQSMANTRQQIPVDQPVSVSPGPVVAPTPAPVTSNGWNNWFGSSSSTACPDNSAAAALAQQKLDAQVAVGNSQALAAIANSNASGAALYNAYIDLAFSSLQQAVAGIADQAVQQQVIQYMQNKLASMKASVNANNYSSRVLGKYSSKKEPKKSKRSRAHATR